jgi:hypothetical protein
VARRPPPGRMRAPPPSSQPSSSPPNPPSSPLPSSQAQAAVAVRSSRALPHAWAPSAAPPSPASAPPAARGCEQAAVPWLMDGTTATGISADATAFDPAERQRRYLASQQSLPCALGAQLPRQQGCQRGCFPKRITEPEQAGKRISTGCGSPPGMCGAPAAAAASQRCSRSSSASPSCGSSSSAPERCTAHAATWASTGPLEGWHQEPRDLAWGAAKSARCLLTVWRCRERREAATASALGHRQQTRKACVRASSFLQAM